jgi:hypothetical protein
MEAVKNFDSICYIDFGIFLIEQLFGWFNTASTGGQKWMNQSPVRAVARGGIWGLQPPQCLAEQLTLSQPGGQIMPTAVLQAPSNFQTLRRPCQFGLIECPKAQEDPNKIVNYRGYPPIYLHWDFRNLEKNTV